MFSMEDISWSNVIRPQFPSVVTEFVIGMKCKCRMVLHQTFPMGKIVVNEAEICPDHQKCFSAKDFINPNFSFTISVGWGEPHMTIRNVM